MEHHSVDRPALMFFLPKKIFVIFVKKLEILNLSETDSTFPLLTVFLKFDTRFLQTQL